MRSLGQHRLNILKPSISISFGHIFCQSYQCMLALEMHMHNYVMNNTHIFVSVIGMQLANVGKILRVSFAFDTVLSLFFVIH